MRHSLSILWVVLASSSVAAVTSSAHASTLQQWWDCSNLSISPEVRISDCTAVYSSPVASRQNRYAALVNRAQAWEMKGDHQSALADIGQAIKIDARSPEASLMRSKIWETLGEFALAISNDDQIILSNPKSAAAYNARCWARTLSSGDLAQALADCDRAIQLAPRRWEYFDSRALTHFKRGEYSEAVADEDAAERLSPNHAALLFVRGASKERLGRKDEGAVDIAAALAIDPKTTDTYAKWGVAPSSP